MKKMYDARFKVDVYFIGQGEFFVSNQSEIISTTLGSCISACIFDPHAKVGGMNHYMLPGPTMEVEDLVFGKAKYGINSMEMLINETLKAGAQRSRLKAKMFGGANMFGFSKESDRVTVGEQNIEFCKEYLAQEGIPIINRDVGLDHARRVYFDTTTGHVKLFRIGKDKKDQIILEETKYKKTIESQKEKTFEDNTDKITFF